MFKISFKKKVNVLILQLKYLKVDKLVASISVFLVILYCVHPGRFASHYPYIEDNVIENKLEKSSAAKSLSLDTVIPLCPFLKDTSFLYPNEFTLSNDLQLLAHKLSIEPGGSWKPSHCIPLFEVAIIVPYRNRLRQLLIFLNYMHSFLQKQLLQYRIVVVEQYGNSSFNRAKLFNIGFAETMKIASYPCIIFHDVDLIPQNLANIYACTQQPRHMSSSLNTFRYNLPYHGLFGGVVSLSRYQFELVNGFSNVFYGWGGEDDDFQNRIIYKGLKIIRFSPKISTYMMLAHSKDKPSPDRYKYLDSGRERFNSDGLNSLKYDIIKKELLSIYTWILVDL